MENKLTKRQINAAKTKERLHDTALELMDKYGLENITIQDICNAAGVSVGTFYNYYKTKDELLLRGVLRTDQWTKQLEEIEADKYDPVKQICFFFAVRHKSSRAAAQKLCLSRLSCT